jgi:hypothetical protein
MRHSKIKIKSKLITLTYLKANQINLRLLKIILHNKFPFNKNLLKIFNLNNWTSLYNHYNNRMNLNSPKISICLKTWKINQLKKMKKTWNAMIFQFHIMKKKKYKYILIKKNSKKIKMTKIIKQGAK